MILLIDNYDSFTFNLYQCLGAIDPHCEIVVRRNDAITLDDIDALNPTHLIVSPGPGTPDTAGISVDAIQHLAGRIPILGVCLGHQCIAQAFGGTVGPAARLMHGKTSQVTHDGRTVFAGLDNPFVATRYHSLAVLDASLPQSLQVSARTDDGEIMALRHRELPIDGVQFHPESFLTRLGPSLMANFLTAQLRPADQLSSAP